MICLIVSLMCRIQYDIDKCERRDCEITIDTRKYESSALRRAKRVLEQNNFSVNYSWDRPEAKIKYKL